MPIFLKRTFEFEIGNRQLQHLRHGIIQKQTYKEANNIDIMLVKFILLALLVQILNNWKDCEASFPSDPTYYPVDLDLVYTWNR